MVREKNVPQGYKQTEVGVIPEDWEVTSINDSSTLKARIGWQGLTTKEYLPDGKYYLVTGTDFVNGKIEWDICNFVDADRYNQDKNIQIKVGDVLVTKDGTIGKVAFIDYLPKEATLNSGVFVVRPKDDNYDSLYFNYIMNFKIFDKFLNKLTAGSTILHLYQKDFIKFCFPLPPLPEQKAIAKVLSDVDELITSIEKLINKKQKIKQGTMQLLLTGKKRLPGFTGEWEVKRLGEIVRIVNGGTPSTTNSSYWNGNIKWCTPTDITKCRSKYLKDTEKKITKNGLNNSSATLLPRGTLLLCSRATIGEIRIAYDEISTNQGFKSLICENNVYNEYLYYYINQIKGKFIEKASGSTFLEISKKDIAYIKMELPLLPEQKAIAQILSDMDSEIEALEKKLEKYKLIKEGMMDKLLTGEVRLV
ncbi:MAG: restriction endonuclease subunit S [Dethiobacteria bacterium]|jgi:type I restriction enzyme S subunit